LPALTLALLLPGCAPTPEQPKLIPSDSTYDDHFGLSVALRGDDALIGATGASSRGRTGTGAAYVFVRTSAGWSEQFKLFGTESDGYDDAGSAVALDGNTALVGALGAFTQGSSAGATYVFQRSGSTWTQQARLVAQDPRSGARFGNAVALAGDTALIAADRASSAAGMDSGTVYSFTRLGDKWQQQQKLEVSDGSYSPGFGAALALSQDTLLVGAKEAERAGLSGVGAAYVFVRSNGTWTQQQKLVASDGGPYDSFGAAVAIEGDTALIAAPRTPGAAGPDTGTVYLDCRIYRMSSRRET
jgi:hypothetical protein